MFETAVRIEIEDGLLDCHSRFSRALAQRLSILEARFHPPSLYLSDNLTQNHLFTQPPTAKFCILG